MLKETIVPPYIQYTHTYTTSTEHCASFIPTIKFTENTKAPAGIKP